MHRVLACLIALLLWLVALPGSASFATKYAHGPKGQPTSTASQPKRAVPPPLPVVYAPEAIVIDGKTGRILYAKHADVLHYPASTVKIMTALVVLRRHVSLNRIETIPYDATVMGGSTAGLYLGERLTIWDLLHAMLLPSGNDAAEAVADFISLQSSQFVDLMNQTARQLGLRSTHYLTPNGFDEPGQYTTARDLAFLARIAMRNPKFAAIVRTKTWVGHPIDAGTQTWKNLNQLLWSNPTIDGVKTGTTNGAGACLVSSEKWKHRWIIAVNMGSSEAARFSDGSALLKYGMDLELSGF